MKLSPKAKCAIGAALLLFLSAQLASSLIRSEGIIFQIRHWANLCKTCAVAQHNRHVTILGMTFKNSWPEETPLHLQAFPEVPHSFAHSHGSPLLAFDKHFSLTAGYKTLSWSNDWAIHNIASKFGIESTVPPRIFFSPRPYGFPLHENPLFAAAFARLRSSDRSWADEQWKQLGLVLDESFPSILLHFKTNKNEQALFNLLQRTNVGTCLPRDYQQFPLHQHSGSH
jgi:hypothetical protein